MFLFLVRFIKHLLILMFVCLPLQALGVLILFPVCVFYDVGKLPRFLRWFDSADPYVGRNTDVIDNLNSNHSAVKKFTWLALRNPINYFGYKVLGLEYKSKYLLVFTQGFNSLHVGDSSGKKPGFLYNYLIDCETHKAVAYEYYFIFKFSSNYCFRFRMGHKIGIDNKAGDQIQYVFVIQPFKSYSGI